MYLHARFVEIYIDSLKRYLVCWVDEGASFSVITKSCLPEAETEDVRVGEVYSARYLGKRYKARVAAIGRYNTLANTKCIVLVLQAV